MPSPFSGAHAHLGSPTYIPLNGLSPALLGANPSANSSLHPSPRPTTATQSHGTIGTPKLRATTPSGHKTHGDDIGLNAMQNLSLHSDEHMSPGYHGLLSSLPGLNSPSLNSMPLHHERTLSPAFMSERATSAPTGLGGRGIFMPPPTTTTGFSGSLRENAVGMSLSEHQHAMQDLTTSAAPARSIFGFDASPNESPRSFPGPLANSPQESLPPPAGHPHGGSGLNGSLHQQSTNAPYQSRSSRSPVKASAAGPWTKQH
jgi:hypothetical protein